MIRQFAAPSQVRPRDDHHVRMAPRHHLACLQWCSPNGDALLEAPADAVAEFLAETARLVPPGTEYQHIDVDAALGALLGES